MSSAPSQLAACSPSRRLPRLLDAATGRASLVHALARSRTLRVMAAYIALAAAANALAFLLRFDGSVPPLERNVGLRTLPWLLATSAVVFVPFRLYRGLWRFSGIWDLCELAAAVTLSSLVFYLLVHHWLGFRDYPRSVFILTALLSIVLIGSVWLVRRLAAEVGHRRTGKRILIYGAGEAGDMIVGELKRNGYRPVGFVDDDASKVGTSIQRVPILGGHEDLPRIVEATRPDEVLVAMPSVGPATVRRIVTRLEPFKVPITTLPPLREILDGTVTISHMRKLAIEDLLERVPVHLELDRARGLIEGRRVMVTGAGGSIGSELCRQIIALGPEALVLYERYENNLYTVMNSLPDQGAAHGAIGDVTDARRLDGVLRQHRPHVIFHAAAHKHVPLMELNPCEAVKNNVVGTRMVAEGAIRHGVDRFVLISTDKAVNPSSLMGATKRLAELVVQAMGTSSHCRFATVRFGNVLGSNGSVIPRWLDQIAGGGPVTVTHRDIKRYFMLIPEAVQLILQAASVMRGGEILVLDMGDQIKLLDMARHLIRLSGYLPEQEIPIDIVGLRPGEKLSEELVGPDEQIDSSPAAKVLQLRALTRPDPERVLAEVTALGSYAFDDEAANTLDQIRRIVPTFRPGPVLCEVAARSKEPRRHVARARGARVAAVPAAVAGPRAAAFIEH